MSAAIACALLPASVDPVLDRVALEVLFEPALSRFGVAWVEEGEEDKARKSRSKVLVLFGSTISSSGTDSGVTVRMVLSSDAVKGAAPLWGVEGCLAAFS